MEQLVRSFDQGEWNILRLDFSEMSFNRINNRFDSMPIEESYPLVERVSVGGAVIHEGQTFTWKHGPNVYD